MVCALLVVAMLAVGGLFELFFARRLAAQCARVLGDAPKVVATSLDARLSLLAVAPSNDNAICPPSSAAPDAETLPPAAVSGVRAAHETGRQRPVAIRGAA